MGRLEKRKDVVVSSLRLSSVDLGLCLEFLYKNANVELFKLKPSAVVQNIVETFVSSILEQEPELKAKYEVDPNTFVALYVRATDNKQKVVDTKKLKIVSTIKVEQEKPTLGLSNEQAMELLGLDENKDKKA